MEERPRVTPSEVLRSTRPAEREEIQRPAPQMDDEMPDWAKTEMDPKKIDQDINQKRETNPNYLKGVVTSGGGGTKIPEDTYDAELVKVEETTVMSEGIAKPVYEWYFRISDTDPDYKGTVIRVLSSRSLHESSKNMKWIAEILGHSLPAGSGVNFPDYFGKKCWIKVKFNKGGYSTVDAVLKASTRASGAR